ncbi:hypothetical protein MT325_m585R [Paramecium bursaria chlorella virus MT325]|uniref:Uncharacterized protein m585R n=1 Tax=Paramecium bursaria Chlorella virus MT325 TaxID=346932 RepID=A7IUW5_PBCVM|nr:hypothetical protein MT325_m585R [Paramecium bursaria chlorella virus MT325]
MFNHLCPLISFTPLLSSSSLSSVRDLSLENFQNIRDPILNSSRIFAFQWKTQSAGLFESFVLSNTITP